MFGCPGNRDELKREIMGEIAGKYSDFCVITSDNPQFENSYRIMRQIEQGVYKTNCPYKLVDDREQAIGLALSLAQAKTTVLIVGKGVEDYQNINGEHIPYSDKKAVEKLFGVKVLKVNTMNVNGKKKRVGYHQGRTSDWKKAIVTIDTDPKAETYLAKGGKEVKGTKKFKDSIEDFTGA